VDGGIAGNANPGKFKAHQRKLNPVFEYSLFGRNPSNWVMPLAIDESYPNQGISDTENNNEKLKLIGLQLFEELINI
jgi:hypothetical protein